MKQVLIVDDEKPFLLSVEQGLKARLKKTKVLTAQNGVEALALLRLTPIDLLVTDLKMPVMDGFELLTTVSRDFSDLPVIVMTALGTPEVQQRLEEFGAIRCLEKPMDLTILSDSIRQTLDSRTSGYVQGIPLPTFVQLLEIEKKSCTLQVRSEGRLGYLTFSAGALADARFDNLTGEVAALEILSWAEAAIEMDALERAVEMRIEASLTHLLLEALRLKDEKEWIGQGEMLPAPTLKRTREEGAVDLAVHEAAAGAPGETRSLSLREHLTVFSGVDGFAGVGFFTRAGEALAMHQPEGQGRLQGFGSMAQCLVQNARAAVARLGAGAEQLVHVEAEQAQILIRHLPRKSEPLLLVLLLRPGASLGMAKLRIGRIVQELAAGL